MIQSELYAVEVNGVIDYAVRPAGKRSAIIETDVHHSRGVAQPGSAPALGAGGPRFKSARPDQQFFVPSCRSLRRFHPSHFEPDARSSRVIAGLQQVVLVTISW